MHFVSPIRQVISCNKNICTLQITDTTGSHQFPAMQRLNISKGHAFILVFSVTSKQSLEELKPIYNVIREVKVRLRMGRAIDKNRLLVPAPPFTRTITAPRAALQYRKLAPSKKVSQGFDLAKSRSGFRSNFSFFFYIETCDAFFFFFFFLYPIVHSFPQNTIHTRNSTRWVVFKLRSK